MYLFNWQANKEKTKQQQLQLRLSMSATTQTQIQGFELAHPSIYTIHDLREWVKWLILQNHGKRISKTQSNGEISWNFDEDPVLMIYQKPEALTQINNTLQKNICK